MEVADLERVAAWNHQLQVDEGAAVMEVEAIADRLRRWLDGEYAGVVFESEGMPVGYALFRPIDPDAEGEGGVYLRQFFVVPECRRRGVGSAAFQALLAQVVRGRRLVLEVLESNPAGLRFWRSLGLAPYSTRLEHPADVEEDA